MSGHAALEDPKLLPKLYGSHPHEPYRATQSKLVTFFSFWYRRLMFELHMHEALERAHRIETFMFNAHQPAEARFTSQGSQDLVKLLPL